MEREIQTRSDNCDDARKMKMLCQQVGSKWGKKGKCDFNNRITHKFFMNKIKYVPNGKTNGNTRCDDKKKIEPCLPQYKVAGHNSRQSIFISNQSAGIVDEAFTFQHRYQFRMQSQSFCNRSGGNGVGWRYNGADKKSRGPAQPGNKHMRCNSN